MAKSNHATRNKQLVRPTGLTEALWACVLDDYLSEEEEGEISKVLGYHEKAPWYLNPEAVACTPTRNTTRRIQSRHQQDPRDPKERGGRDSDSSDEERDGTPGVWDETSSTAELPPVMWLSLPPNNNKAARKGGDWDVSTGDWDMDVLSPRERNEILLQRQGSKHNSPMSTKSASARSRQSSKSNTFSTSMLSTPCGNSYAMAMSRSGSHRSSPRSRSQAIVAELRRSRSKSRGKNRASMGGGSNKKTTSEAREERQPQSRWMWGNHETRS